ncbi:exodeoxyribonuclease VII large subunit [Zobellella aerophila]|uniref:Exodeoxyribonuclease 7 large subunit n=1 Tax=Zobellella aerophila TaxID=870480 RepID=A0ABP6VB12_9GAMM
MHQEKLTDIYTVTRLNRHARLLLEGEMGAVWLTGEISNLAMPGSGHWYFTLKDSQSQVRCAMFRGNNRSVKIRPKNGDQVLIFAKVTLYEPRGDYQLVAETMASAGEGLLRQEFEALKARLGAEGLFDSERKRPLPTHPRRIGIISSPTGAALRDIISVLARRAPGLEVIIYPSQVQGDAAVPQLVQALATANRRHECSLLILARGGGSLEDLWCFNDERLVRAIADSGLPVVSAVGHETDISLADLVADLRAPTPSAAAELVSRDSSEQAQQWRQWQQRLTHAGRRYLAGRQLRLDQLSARLQRLDPQQRLQQQAQRLDLLAQRLNRAMALRLLQARQHLGQLTLRLQHQSPVRRLTEEQARLGQLQRRLATAMAGRLGEAGHRLSLAGVRLNGVSPLATLSRGYSITSHQGRVVMDAQALTVGNEIETRLARGVVTSRVIGLTTE